MSLSRRGFLAALGLALPAVTLLGEDAEAATRNRRRKTVAQAPVARKKKVAAAAKPKAHKVSHLTAPHRPIRRRRRHTAA